MRESYGGVSVTEDYAVSPAISIAFIACSHAMHLPPAQWDDIAGTIRRFSTATGAHLGKRTFYEMYYRQVHPDVDAAIRRGRYASAADHYRSLGWKEKRRFKVMVP